MFSTILNNASFDAFDKIQKGILDYSNTNAPIMGIDPHKLADLSALSTSWQDAFVKCKHVGTISPLDKEVRRMARKELSAKLKPFIIADLYYNEKVTTADLAGMNLPLSLRSSPTPIVFNKQEVPNFYVQAMRGGVVNFLCRNNAGKIGKPAGALSLHIKYYIGTTPPANPNEYPFDINATSCKGDIVINNTQGLQFVFFVARWTCKGQEFGSYSAPVAIAAMV